MEWKEFYNEINNIWKKNRKNPKLRYNGIYKLLHEVTLEDKDNLIPSLKATCNSEIQLINTLTLLTTIFSVGVGFISFCLSESIEINDLVSTISYSILLMIIFLTMSVVAFTMFELIKKYRFILCVLDDIDKI